MPTDTSIPQGVGSGQLFSASRTADRIYSKLPASTAVVLALISFISLAVVGYLLSSFQAYQRLQIAIPSNSPVSIYSLRRAAAEMLATDAQIENLKKDITKLEIDIRTNTAESAAISKMINDELEAPQDALILKLQSDLAGQSIVVTKGNYAVRRRDFTKKLGEALEKSDPAAPSLEKIRQAIKIFSESDRSADFSKSDGKLDDLKHYLRNDRADSEAKTYQMDALGDYRDDILKTLFPDNVVPAYAHSIVSELEETSSSYRLVWLPQESLVVLIVVFGGLLGSAAYLTHDFSDDSPARPFNYYVLRLLVGMLTSLLLFIVIKAGVIVAVDARSVHSSATELNPFFTAFIGIVGGLVSDQVVQRVMSTANGWLQGAEAPKDRYALGDVKNAFAGGNDRDQFVALTNTQREALDGWLDRDQRVPQQAQLTISYWMKRPVRELFSDLPPSPSVSHARS